MEILPAKVINKEQHLVAVAISKELNSYLSGRGFSMLQVEYSDLTGRWYEAGFAPMKSDAQKQEEQDTARISEIETTLKQMDQDSIRSICSVLLNPKDIFGLNKLREIEKLKVQLREERSALWDKWRGGKV